MNSAATIRRPVVIGISLLVAILLSILPLPIWAMWFRPRWIMLVIFYWALALPFRVSVATAWCVGLLADLINGTLLGEHALALSTTTYLIVKFHPRIQAFPYWQQIFTVFALIVLYQLELFLIQGLLGEVSFTWHFWMPCLSSILFWPWVYSILKDCQRKFKISDPSLDRYNFGRE